MIVLCIVPSRQVMQCTFLYVIHAPVLSTENGVRKEHLEATYFILDVHQTVNLRIPGRGIVLYIAGVPCIQFLHSKCYRGMQCNDMRWCTSDIAFKRSVSIALIDSRKDQFFFGGFLSAVIGDCEA